MDHNCAALNVFSEHGGRLAGGQLLLLRDDQIVFFRAGITPPAAA